MQVTGKLLVLDCLITNKISNISLDISNNTFKKIIQIKQLFWLLYRRMDYMRHRGTDFIQSRICCNYFRKKLVHAFSLEGNTVFDRSGQTWQSLGLVIPHSYFFNVQVQIPIKWTFRNNLLKVHLQLNSLFINSFSVWHLLNYRIYVITWNISKNKPLLID